jgi:hypothetical protein
MTRMENLLRTSAIGPAPLAAAELRRGASLVQSERGTIIGLFILISAAYAYAAISRSMADHFWMDEVLAVDAAGQPTLAAVRHAIWSGTDFSPPTYHYLLHIIGGIFGDTRLVWRAPSILGVYGAGLCTYMLLIRAKLDRSAAILGFAVVLGFALFDYAIQVRQYGLLAFGLAAALLLWAGMTDGRGIAFRACCLWLVLAACLVLHFYGAIEVAVVALAELIYLIDRKRFRVAIWAALALTVPVEAALLPLATHLAAFNAGDSAAPGYYAQPTLGRLVGGVIEIIGGGELGMLLLFAAVLTVTLSKVLDRSGAAAAAKPGRTDRASRLSEIQIVMICLGALPLIAFAFSFFVTKSFSPRYMAAGALLPAVAAACLLDRLPTRRVVALALVPLIAGILVNRARATDQIADALAVLQNAKAPFPIVVGEGLLYIELMAAADSPTQARLVYLKRPADQVSPDPTNENEVLRLATFLAAYHVDDQSAFLSSNPDFYELYRPGMSVDTTTPALIERGALGRPVDAERGIVLFHSSPAAAQPDGGMR